MSKKDKKPSKKVEKAVKEVKEFEITEVSEDTENPDLPEAPEVTEAADDTGIELVEDTDVTDEAEEIAEETDESEEAAEETDEAEEVAEETDESEEVAEETDESEEVAEETDEAEEVAEETDEAEEVAEETDEAEEVDEDTDESEEVAEETDESEEVAEDTDESEEVAEETDESEEVAEETDESEEVAEETDESEEVAEDTDEEDEFDFIDDDTPIEEIHFENERDSEEVVDLFEEAAAAETDTEDDEDEEEEDSEDEEPEIETVDEDDYLDYDDDDRPKRPKKIVSGKAAVVTMLFTFLAMIGITAGIFAFLTYYQKPMELSLVSYTDRFNKCDANSFAYSALLGLGDVSYSDAEMTLSSDDVKALSSGKTVTKFNGMANITADVRFGKLVSMDFTFSDELNNAENPSGYYMMLAGNVMSGLADGVVSSDYGFMFAYSVISYATAVSGQENIYCYQIEDMKIYVDYTDAVTTGLLSKLKIHVEKADPHYIDWSEVDLSWLPWKNNDVSASDVSGTDA